MTDLVQQLRERVAEAVTRMEASTASILRRQAEVLAIVEREHSAVSTLIERRALASVEELRERVLATARSGAFAALTAREARAGARMLGLLPPPAMGALLRERPEVTNTFVEEFFRSWDHLAASSERDGYASLVVSMAQGVPFKAGIAREELVAPDGHVRLAMRVPRRSVRECADWCQSSALPLRWAFTAHVMAQAIAWMLQERGLEPVWSELGEHPDLAAVVLPPLEKAGGRWFFGNPAARKGGSPAARARVVASLLGSAVQSRVPLSDAIVEGLLDSDFGDPRMPPESIGWQWVRHHDATAFGAFLEQLVAEDLTLFFDHAMHEHARRTFWLRYLKSIRRTLCVLHGGLYRGLRDQLAGSAGTMKAALQRVKRFSGGASVSAFCLYFDQIVVVEFSHTGNAAYIYGRREFDQAIEPLLRAERIASEKALKVTGLALGTIKHVSGWEPKAVQTLYEHGVRR